MLRDTLLATAFVLACSVEVEASPTCMSDRDDLVAILDEKFDEVQAGIGLSNSARPVELFVAPSGSWTIIGTLPNGWSCIIAAGQSWRQSQLIGEPS